MVNLVYQISVCPRQTKNHANYLITTDEIHIRS